ILIDDVPFGSSTALGQSVLPDLDPSDLERIEVLRGPQGTLYGATGIGGVLKYVTVDPSTAGVNGRLRVGSSSVYNGAELGYDASGSINLPVSDTLALRANVYTREEPGFIDSTISGRHGIDQSWYSGARLAAKWNPSETFTAKVSALYQSARVGLNHVDVLPGLGTFQNNETPNTGVIDRDVQAYSLTLKANVGVSELTSLTGYNVAHYRQ